MISITDHDKSYRNGRKSNHSSLPVVYIDVTVENHRTPQKTRYKEDVYLSYLSSQLQNNSYILYILLTIRW